MAAAKEAHILKRYNRVIYPRTIKEQASPSVNVLLSQDFDYPRIIMTNHESSNLKYHHQALRSSLADVVYRSSSGPRTPPPSHIKYQSNWVTNHKLDKLPAAPSRDDFGQSVILIPIMRHRSRSDQESMVLMLIVTAKGLLLVNPMEHRCKRSIKHLLESDDIIKIVLNASSEVHMYWTLLQSACRKIFCLRSHLKALVKKKTDNMDLYYTHEDIIPKFNLYYTLRTWKPVILQSDQDDIDEIGLLVPVKCVDLQTYAKTCVSLLDKISTDDRDVDVVMDWGLVMEPLGQYLTLEGLHQKSFWMLVATGLDQRLTMHEWIPLVYNVSFRLFNGRMDCVNVSAVREAYDRLQLEKSKDRKGQPKVLTEELCKLSAERESAFITCLLLPPGERRVRPGICSIPGCFNDTMIRMDTAAPVFFTEFRQGF